MYILSISMCLQNLMNFHHCLFKILKKNQNVTDGRTERRTTWKQYTPSIKRRVWMYTHGNFPYTNLHEIRIFCLLYPDIRVYHRWFQHPLGSCVLFTVLVLEHSCNLQFPPSLITSRNSSRWYSKIKVTLLFWNFKRTFIKQTCNISIGPILSAGQCKILFIVPQLYIWATAWQHQQNDLCAQRRLRSALASALSDQSLRCPHEKTLGP